MTDRRIVSTPAAPKAIGPYSQGVVAGGFVFTAGQIALDPATGAVVGGGDVALETERCLKNLEAVLVGGRARASTSSCGATSSWPISPTSGP